MPANQSKAKRFFLMAAAFPALIFFLFWMKPYRSQDQMLMMAAVMLIYCALIIVLAVMNGFEEDLRSKILGIRSHIEVTMDMAGPLINYRTVREEIDKTPGVVNSTPFIYTEAMIRSSNGVAGIVIRGMDTLSACSGGLLWPGHANRMDTVCGFG